MYEVESAEVWVSSGGKRYQIPNWVWKQVRTEVRETTGLTFAAGMDTVRETERRCVDLVDRGFLDA